MAISSFAFVTPLPRRPRIQAIVSIIRLIRYSIETREACVLQPLNELNELHEQWLKYRVSGRTPLRFDTNQPHFDCCANLRTKV
jgi:hypothetical protein